MNANTAIIRISSNLECGQKFYVHGNVKMWCRNVTYLNFFSCRVLTIMSIICLHKCAQYIVLVLILCNWRASRGKKYRVGGFLDEVTAAIFSKKNYFLITNKSLQSRRKNFFFSLACYDSRQHLSFESGWLTQSLSGLCGRACVVQAVKSRIDLGVGHCSSLFSLRVSYLWFNRETLS